MWIFAWKGKSGFSASSTAEDVTEGVDGTGLTAIITGATSGLGKETARVLAMRGVHVVLPVRNVDAGKLVKQTILESNPNAKVDVMELDVSSLASVRDFASEFNSSGLPLNILINNAGVMSPPFTLSKDNIELQFATNHLGHFHLTNLLVDNMKDTAKKSQKEGRIVIVSSEVHKLAYGAGIHFDKITDEKSYSPLRAYAQSKLANVLHANELARRFKEEGVNITANSLHPGVIATNLSRHQGVFGEMFGWIGQLVLKNVPQGAATTCYLALNPQVKGVSGEYFADSNITTMSKQAKDTELAKKLWDFSLSISA